MSERDGNIKLPDNKPVKKDIFVEMNNPEEFKRLMTILYNGRNSQGLQLVGTTDLMESEFVQILLDPIRRNELLRRYKIILDNFKMNTRTFPPVYQPVVDNDGKIVNALKTPIGEFFGGWQKFDNRTVRFEDNLDMKALAMKGDIMYTISVVGDRYIRFISDISYLYAIVKNIDIEFNKEEYKIRDLDGFSRVIEQQRVFLKDSLQKFIESGNPVVRCIPFKVMNGEKIYVESDFMKGSLVKFLQNPHTMYLNETLSRGNFKDNFFTIEVLKHIINGVIGEENYIMLMSEPIAIGDDSGKIVYSVRCIYMDKLGNIGYSQVQTASSYGNTPEQQQRAVQGLAARQAIIKAFPAFKSLKDGRGEEPELMLYREEWKMMKDRVFNRDNFRITSDSRMRFRIEPKKESDIKVDEYNLGLITDTLNIYEEKIPKRPLLIEKEDIKKKEKKLVEVTTEERDVVEEPEVVVMEEEKENN